MSREFSIRDPILEGIACTKEEKDLINSPLVQRLKWVTQLSMVNQVYNGATHSRFAHSLGALSTASDYMEHLLQTLSPYQIRECGMDRPGLPDKEHFIQVARIAGLLHDIGHGPFSHSFDHQVYSKIYGIEDGGHDIARIELIKHKDIYPYIETCGVSVWELLEIWAPGTTGETFAPIYRQMFDIIKIIVEGPLGADRMDFTRRDSYHTGMQHQGTIPVKKIIHDSKLYIDKGVLRISYNAKCLGDIIRTLDGRLSMYSSVYMHRTSMAASLLVELMLDLSCDTLNLVELTKNPITFRTLNDHKIFGMISEWQSTKYVSNGSEFYPEPNPKMERAKKLYYQLMDRHLPKMDFEENINNLDEPYDEELYKKKWYHDRNSETFSIVKTRVLSGISAGKFDKHNITFHKKELHGLTCAELLEEMGYKTPIMPYYIVRGYTLQ